MSATFSGVGYDPKLDGVRLTLQIGRIRAWALAREWFTLREARESLERLYPGTFFPESSTSAQIRNLEKPAAGRLRCKKEKRRRAGVRGPGAGIFEYRLRPAPGQPWLQLGLFVEKQSERVRPAEPADAGNDDDDGSGRERFFREARRIAGLDVNSDHGDRL
jgi:hypothetical protein